jgi:hypothetical protein
LQAKPDTKDGEPSQDHQECGRDASVLGHTSAVALKQRSGLHAASLSSPREMFPPSMLLTLKRATAPMATPIHRVQIRMMMVAALAIAVD